MTQKKIAIYCRVSTKDQSCERQEKDLIAFSERLGYEIIGIYKENASGAKNGRAIRKQVIELAKQRYIDSILITELSRWGRSTIDLVTTLQLLQSYNVSLLALNGMQYDLCTAHGKMIASVFASIAEFERDLIQERIMSGIALAKSKGMILGRKIGFRPTSDKVKKLVLKARENGDTIRKIAKNLKISPGTVVGIIKRNNNEQTLDTLKSYT